MAWFKKLDSGKTLVLRNPAEKGKRFSRQLNTGLIAETGKELSDTDKAFRRGYLTSRSDNAAAYKSSERKSAKYWAKVNDAVYSEYVAEGKLYGMLEDKDGKFIDKIPLGRPSNLKKKRVETVKSGNFDFLGNIFCLSFRCRYTFM